MASQRLRLDISLKSIEISIQTFCLTTRLSELRKIYFCKLLPFFLKKLIISSYFTEKKNTIIL